MSDKDARLERAREFARKINFAGLNPDGVVPGWMSSFANAECATLENKLKIAHKALKTVLPFVEADAEASHFLEGFGLRTETKQDRILASFKAVIDEIGGGDE